MSRGGGGRDPLQTPCEPWRPVGELDRRGFLRVTAAVGGGLLIGLTPAACRPRDDGGAPQPAERLNAYVAVGPDGWVTLQVPCPEIGQGVRTALPMIVAAEMGARWDRCRFQQAPARGEYGGMSVGGSDSVADYWMPLRRAGAMARVLLTAAAAERLGVGPEELEVADGRVVHPGTERSLGFGELADAAAGMPVPEDVPLRETGSGRGGELLGRAVGPVHAEAVVRGRATYGLDLDSPDRLVAIVERAPVRGGRVRSFDDEAARAVEGVVDVVEVEPRTIAGQLYGAVRSGVAVVASDTWSAMRGRDALSVQWEPSPDGSFSTAELDRRMEEALDSEPDLVLRDEGTPPSPGAGRRVVGRYQTPLLAHVCMEPVNFSADVRDERIVLRGPTQNPRALQAVVAEGMGVPVEQVDVLPTLAGGGFGRRLAFDYGVEAAFLSRRIGRPVQVVWTREDDVRHDYYRPPSAHRLEAVLGEDGFPVSWRHHLATGSLLEHIRGPGAEPVAVYDVQGGADQPYAMPHVTFAYSSVPVGVQLGSWRSVSHSFNVFAVESFLDEVAERGGIDPLELRLRLLPGDGPAEISLPLPGRRGSPAPDRARLRRVLEEVGQQAGWSTPAPPGVARGLACCYYKHTYAAHVAEVEVGAVPRVRRIHVAVDCGRVVNPDGVRAQCEGAAMDALATVLHWGVDVEGGRVVQGNFDDYRPLRYSEAPEVEVYIVPGDAPPSGMGEPPYPSAVAAIANGVSAATGSRVRRLPHRSAPPEDSTG